MPDTQDYDGPSESRMEKAEDELFAAEFSELVDVIRGELLTWWGVSWTEDVAAVFWFASVADGPAVGDTERAVYVFVRRWGFPPALRALARAIEQREATR